MVLKNSGAYHAGRMVPIAFNCRCRPSYIVIPGRSPWRANPESRSAITSGFRVRRHRPRFARTSWRGPGMTWYNFRGDCRMIWIANGLVALVAALHVYFLVLEMFLWTKPLGLKTFRNTPEKAQDSAVLAANQGLRSE